MRFYGAVKVVSVCDSRENLRIVIISKIIYMMKG